MSRDRADLANSTSIRQRRIGPRQDLSAEIQWACEARDRGMSWDAIKRRLDNVRNKGDLTNE